MRCLPGGLIVWALLVSGCNFASQSYNHGKLLNPGEAMTSAGLGTKPHDRIVSHYRYDTVSYTTQRIYDTLPVVGWFNFSLDYRLGVLDKYPFGKGTEIGFHLEGMMRTEPTYDYYRHESGSTPVFFGPPLLEFSARTGFTDVNWGNGVYHHNAGLGWSVGQWVDNGWFLEYAAGWEIGWGIPYASLRGFVTATDALNRETGIGDATFFTRHDRIWALRCAAGCALKLPRLPVLPDFISPEVTLTFPRYSPSSRVGFGCSVGLRWMNGI